jgi:high affinity sulfate transporter 1
LAPSTSGYRRTWLRPDVLAGLAAGTVVIPQAMAYATIAGLPVEVGLYTCMAPMLVYALLGGARALSVSTTSTIAVLVATTLAGLPAATGEDADRLLSAAFTLTFLVGLCLLTMRLFRLGSLVESISPATLTGVQLGVGLTVAASQLPALLGVAPDPDAGGFFAKVADAVRHLPDADSTTVVVSVLAVAVLLVLRRFAPQVPGPLVVVAGAIVLVATTGIERAGTDQYGVSLIDPVPSGLPSPVLPVPGDIVDLLPGALAIAVMAFLETVLVARTNRRRDEPPIDTDQELLAVGIASLAGGLTQTLPPAGGFSQSAVNQRSGARTQVSGLVTAVLAVLVALFLAPLLEDLPQAVLAAMVLVAIIGLLDPRELAVYARIDRAELWVALVVAALGLTGGMLLGVAVGVALTLVLVLRAVNQPQVQPMPSTPGGVLHLRLTGGLYTGNAQSTHDEVLRLVREARPAAHRVVLDGTAVTRVTIPFINTVRSLQDDLAGDRVELTLTQLTPEVLVVLRRSGWWREQEAHGLLDPAEGADRP